jgi:transaldolase/glucose-6-phosphate isomerase
LRVPGRGAGTIPLPVLGFHPKEVTVMPDQRNKTELFSSENSPALQKLIDEDAVGQLRRRDGLMATLGTEDGALKLDWVEGVARLLADPTQLEQVEAEARGIWQRGIRHIIWAGMGGSVIAVRVLCDFGFCSSTNKDQVTIYPLDSTDPAALNDIVRTIAAAKKLAVPPGKDAPNPTFLRALLDDVMMIGVSMGMTSEEPITHLEWFTSLLNQAGLSPAEHLLVMALPGSYLDRFAHEHQAPSLPLQPNGGTGTGGRMSAPTTRVFLLPAALYLTTHFPNQSGQLRSILQQAWDKYNLELAASHPADHPFVQLAAVLSDAGTDGICRLLLSLPEGWQPIVQWIEQLMEESLGKVGKGIVVFDDQTLNNTAHSYNRDGMLYVRVVTGSPHQHQDNAFILSQPYLTNTEPRHRLAALATSFLAWQLTMALYGYLHHITFAGQPAVENYKARARALRVQNDPLQAASNWDAITKDGRLMLLAPYGITAQNIAAVFANTLRQASSSRKQPGTPLSYLDLTINGEAPANIMSLISAHLHRIGNHLLGVPVKLRRAPAAYHSTEQSEMDGPPSLVSLRLLARDHEKIILGTYSDTFLQAQAVSTWQAMLEQGRSCFLLIINGSLDEADEPLRQFFSEVESYLL